MKKLFLVLTSIILCFILVAGCAPEGMPMTPDDLDKIIGSVGGGGNNGGGNAVTITAYLVPGKGATIGGVAGEDAASLYIENAYTVSGKIGDLLPVPDAREKLEFVGWCESKNALANPITKFVGRDKLILYGMWNYTGGGNVDPDDPSISADADFYLAFNGVIDETTRFTVNQNNILEDKEYILTRNFTANEVFTFKSIAPLTTSKETEYPTSADRGFTFGRDKINTINSDDYFIPVDIVSGDSNSGVNASGDYWAKTTSAKIKCKTAGKYQMYITVYQGGWVKVFAKPL